MQPKQAELKKKYGKDKQKLAKEQQKLAKEQMRGLPGCVGTMLIQMPIWIALFYSIRGLLPGAPEGLLKLAQNLYSWDIVYSMVPLGDNFLWLNLAEPNLFLGILVGGTMWVQQKMTMTPTTDPKQQAQSRMMLWLIPLLFGFISITSFPGGLSLFWVTSTVIRIGIQYFAAGWGGLVSTTAKKQVTRDRRYKERIAQVEEAPLDDAEVTKEEEGLDYGKPGDERQDRRGGYPTRPRATRPQPRRGRGHRPKRR